MEEDEHQVEEDEHQVEEEEHQVYDDEHQVDEEEQQVEHLVKSEVLWTFISMPHIIRIRYKTPTHDPVADPGGGGGAEGAYAPPPLISRPKK